MRGANGICSQARSNEEASQVWSYEVSKRMAYAMNILQEPLITAHLEENKISSFPNDVHP